MKLDGFGIFVRDMPAMIRFYRDVLGFEIKEKEDTTNVFLEKDGTLFLMYGRDDFEEMTDHTYDYAKGIHGHFEIALSVKDYNEVDLKYQALLEKGAAVIMPPKTMPWGQRTCYIADPEGNPIEIGSFHQ